MTQRQGAPTPLGYQRITDLTGSTGFTIPDGTSHVLVVVEAQAVRWRDDGSDPTATIGMPLSAGDTMEYDGSKIPLVRFIEVVGGAILNISYYGG